MKATARSFQGYLEIAEIVAQGDFARATQLGSDLLARELRLPLPFGLMPDYLHPPFRNQPVTREVAEILRHYGGRMARQGLLFEAEPVLAASLALEPNNYSALIDLGTLRFTKGDLRRAREHFEVAMALNPEDVAPVAALAALAARELNAAEAKMLAERALSLSPDNLSAHLAIARADLLDGQAALTVERLTRLLARDGLNVQNRIAILDLRAEALDALDQCRAAFDDYAARNAILRDINTPHLQQTVRERRVDQARRLADFVESSSDEQWRTTTGHDHVGAGTVRSHVFLLGFPRSGTTLLEKTLAGHPDVITLEEVDYLTDISAPLIDSIVGLRTLRDLTAEQAQTYRQSYWERVRASLPNLEGKATLIDKMPLNTVMLPVIAKLFPDAKVLFAIRDPRDVVLSCFRHRFRVNASMYEFLTLQDAADFYHAVMLLAEICRVRCAQPRMTVRHEALVTNLAEELESILTFLGLDWDAAVLDFDERAKQTIKTPSDLQLRQGLNRTGMGRWSRYESVIAPILPTLEQWVHTFEYEPTRPKQVSST